MTPAFDDAMASRFARVALDNVVREFPNKLDHLMAAADDVRGPASLHPVFYGSYDWHSSVHMHWTLVMLLLHRPSLPEAADIVARLDAHFTTDRIAGELAYLARPTAAAFERPYGWAWLLKLCEGLQALAVRDARAVPWRDRMQPLAEVFGARIERWLPRAVHPSRAGSHANGAFALTLMLDYATTTRAASLRDALLAKARAWYGDDRDYPVRYETSSEDFLSNGLLEAMLMHRVLCIEAPAVAGRERADPGRDCDQTAYGEALFHRWWQGFVPDIAQLTPWLTPLVASDREDGRFATSTGSTCRGPGAGRD